MNLTIPARAKPQIASLLSTPVASLDALYVALAKASPQYEMEGLAGDIAGEVGIPHGPLVDILQLLAAWYWLRADYGQSPEEIVAEISEAAIQGPQKDLSEGWDERREAIAKILHLDSTFGISAKANFLAAQSFRTFNKVRILSDARPIFPGGASENPGAFVVIHTLEISATESGDRKNWFFSLDLSDLHSMRECVDKAIRKHEALSEWIEKSGSLALGA